MARARRDRPGQSYAAVCDALAAFDVRDRLGEITAPVVAVAGEEDQTAPVGALREIADGVHNGHLVTLPGVAHLGPAEARRRSSDCSRELGESLCGRRSGRSPLPRESPGTGRGRPVF